MRIGIKISLIILIIMFSTFLAQGAIHVYPDNTLQYSDLTEKSSTDSSYPGTLLYTYGVPYDIVGTINFSFDIKVSAGGWGYGEICFYPPSCVNSPSWSSLSTSYETISYNRSTTVSVPNGIQLFAGTNYEGKTTYIKNFKIYYGIVPDPIIGNITNPLNNSRLINNTINATWPSTIDIYGDTITYNFQLSNQSNFNNFVNQSNSTNNYTGDIPITDGSTLYMRVRSTNGYNNSNWSSTVQFTENSVPTVSNVTLFPASPSIFDNLSINFSVTDSEGDLTANHTLWYKNGVLQQSLNDSLIVFASGNTSTGELWRVDVYSNDGYNNSTSLPSSEVIIGSTNVAPTYNSITITPAIGQIGTIITINASGIVDDSTSWRLQSYYLSEDNSKVYLGNSSWSNNTTILYNVNSPWSDSGTYTIYTNIYDSGNNSGVQNLTSSTTFNFFVSQITTTVITQSGSGGGLPPTPVVTSTPMVSTINLPSLLQESTGRLILYALFIIGLVIIYVGTTNKRSTLGTIVTGFIFIGFSIYGLYGV